MRLLGTVTIESEGVVPVDHGELGAAQELERRLRRRWGRADGESESDAAYHDASHSDTPLGDHAAIPRSVDLLGYGAQYLSKMSLLHVLWCAASSLETRKWRAPRWRLSRWLRS